MRAETEALPSPAGSQGPTPALLRGLMDRPGRQDERSLMVLDDDLSIAWAERGQGRPVVLLHGTLTTLEDMTQTLGRKLDDRFHVLAFDRPGCGRSGVRRGRDAGLWNQAAVLSAAIDRLGLDRPILVGHSFGASVALAMGVRRPDAVAGVVALAPLVRPEVRLEQWLFGPRAMPTGGWFSAFSHRTSDRALFPVLWRSMFLPQAMPERVAVDFPFRLAGRSESAVRAGEDALAAGPDLLRLSLLAASCRVPTVMMGGDRDVVVRNGVNGRMLAAVMPNARYVDLPGLGHMIHHFAAERVVEAIEALAAGTLPPTPAPAPFKQARIPPERSGCGLDGAGLAGGDFDRRQTGHLCVSTRGGS